MNIRRLILRAGVLHLYIQPVVALLPPRVDRCSTLLFTSYSPMRHRHLPVEQGTDYLPPESAARKKSVPTSNIFSSARNYRLTDLNCLFPNRFLFPEPSLTAPWPSPIEVPGS
jgi:hypothetical protein